MISPKASNRQYLYCPKSDRLADLFRAISANPEFLTPMRGLICSPTASVTFSGGQRRAQFQTTPNAHLHHWPRTVDSYSRSS